MSCRMKGGSVASHAVTSLVTDGAFSKLDGNFTNIVGGRHRKSKQPKRSGGMCMVCGGSKQDSMKHFSDFDNSGLMSVHNKRGGANNPLFDIRYDYTTSMAQPAHGPAVNRALNFEATNLMAAESISSLGSFNKMPEYGNMTDMNNGTFVYGGATRKTKAPKKTASTKAKPSTKSTKSPKKPTKTTKTSKPTTKSTRK
jgi:hypothetical protein